VEVFPNPEFSVDPEPQLGCEFLTVEFENNSTSDTQIYFDWNFGDGTSSTESNPTHFYASPGIYDVTVTLSTLANCIESETFTFNDLIEIYAPPTAGFALSSTQVDLLASGIQVQDLSSGSIGCTYYLSDGGVVNECDFDYVLQESGEITIQQVVVNEYGCTDEISQVVFVDGFAFHAPNAFTPNSDGVNDVWMPIVKGASTISVGIFNRWGEKIFETKSIDQAWTGNVNGGDHFAQDGIYQYLIVVEDLQGLPHHYEGHISLIR
jgi:gliding motility-associated-like protein